MKTLFILLAIIFCQTVIESQSLIFIDENHGNLDSNEVYLDTNQILISDFKIYDYYENRTSIYEKACLNLYFQSDSLIKSQEISNGVVDIDSISNTNVFKFFRKLDSIGNIDVYHQFSDNYSKRFARQRFFIKFNNLINLDSLDKFIDSCNYDLRILPSLHKPTFLPQDRSLIPGTRIDKELYYNYSSSVDPNNNLIYQSNFHSRGFGWGLYSLKVPLAWNIT